MNTWKSSRPLWGNNSGHSVNFFCIKKMNKAGKTTFLCMTKGVNITSASLSVRRHARVQTQCLWNIIIDIEIVLEWSFLLQDSGPPCAAAVGLCYFFPSSTFWCLWNCLEVTCVPQNSVYTMIYGHLQPVLMFKACHFSLKEFHLYSTVVNQIVCKQNKVNWYQMLVNGVVSTSVN